MKPTNFTQGTTFIKWLLKDKAKLAVFAFTTVIDILISFNIEEALFGLSLAKQIFILTILNIGSLILFIYSLVEWMIEKKKV